MYVPSALWAYRVLGISTRYPGPGGPTVASGRPGSGGSDAKTRATGGRRRQSDRDLRASVRSREIARRLAPVLCPVIHDVRDDQPSRNLSRPHRERLRERRGIEVLHVHPQTLVLLEAERADAREVFEHVPVVPYVGLAHVVPGAELAPAPVDVDQV